jgi:TRAP-type C4-dicarboxylate transport system substrate-binding protein
MIPDKHRRLLATLALLLAAGPAQAKTVTIKLGTLAPQGSPWHQVLEEVAQKWSDASEGTVKVRIYPGGVAGNEGDMIRKVGVGQLQAASITSVGLHDISPDPQAVTIPMMVTSYGELDYVMKKMRPKFDAALSAKGFVAVNWSDVGFVHFFTTYPLLKPPTPGQAKVSAWSGDPQAAEAWQAMGFQPVVISATDVIPSLQTGMINTMVDPPLYAFTAHLFEKANNMLDLNWAILTGATVVKKDTWESIPADLRAKLIAIADEEGHKLEAAVSKMNDDAIAQMKAQGLHVNAAEDLPGWRAVAERGWAAIRGKSVPAPVFDEVRRLCEEYRAQTKK